MHQTTLDEMGLYTKGYRLLIEILDDECGPANEKFFINLITIALIIAVVNFRFKFHRTV